MENYNYFIIEKNNKNLKIYYYLTNNKNSYLNYKQGNIILKLSKYNKLNDIKKMIYDNFDLIYNKNMKIKNNLNLYSDYYNKNIFYLFNEKYIIFFNDEVKRYFIDYESKRIYINQKYVNSLNNIKKEILKNELELFLNNNKIEINNRINYFNIEERKYYLRYYKTRYGSYNSTTDIISLNILLARFSKPEILSTIYHEYAHTIYKNHSKEFYNLLLKIYPVYKQVSKTLKKKPAVL